MKDFEKIAQTSREASMPVAFWQLLKDSKKWWLLPILGVLFLFAILLILAGTGAAPFIYTLF